MVPAMIRWVPNEDARRGAFGELVARGVNQDGEAPAPEHAKPGIGGRHTEEQGVRRRGTGGSTGTAVDQVHRRSKRLSLERQGSGTVN